jgi:predicted Rdx family selenoprotein
LAASLKSRFGEDAQIKAGKTGQFDVVVDGKLIFSKAATGRFPLDDEVEDDFAELKGK